MQSQTYTNFPSLQNSSSGDTKLANERLPLIEPSAVESNPWEEESSLSRPRGLRRRSSSLGNGGRGAICMSLLWKLAVLCTVALVCVCVWVTGLWPHQFARLTPAERVLVRNPLIDGHNDLLIFIRALFNNHINDPEFKDKFENGGLPGHVDLPRLDAGRVGGSFWSAFVPCPANGSDFSDDNYALSVRTTLEQLDLFNRLTDLYPHYFTPTPSSSSAVSAFSSGRLISPLGIEGLHQIGNSISTLRLYHSLGVRYATLTWNCHNRYADAALISNDKGETIVAPPLWGGVSDEGHKLIREMNRLGMLVDLSHVSVGTMKDVLGAGQDGWEGSIAPPIFSHSSVKALCPHPRNVPDDVLELVKEKEGLVMVNFSPDFISCAVNDSAPHTSLPVFVNETSTLKQVVKHITYIGDLVGYDYVGIGTDFDGIPAGPRGLEDVSKFPDLVAELLDQGVSEADAGKIVGRNLLRVWAEVDRVSAMLQAEGEAPLEDDLKRPWA